jgi:hypothetical protein
MSETTLTCANHPNRETNLRCNRCGKPICAQCAIQTPVGYRCRDCVRGQQKVFETARQADVVVAGLVAALGVGISVALLSFVGFWGIIVAPVIGGGIGEVVRRAIGRRRSARVFWAAAAGGAIGGAIYMLVAVASRYGWLLGGGASMIPMFVGRIALDLLWPIVDTVLMVASIFYRLRGIQL